jgi:hypothetical protein
VERGAGRGGRAGSAETGGMAAVCAHERSDQTPGRTWAKKKRKGHRAHFFLVEEVYTPQGGRAHSRRLRPSEAARPALMSRAAHAVESKAVIRIEVAVSPRPCLGCAVFGTRLVRRASPPRRPTPVVRSEGGGGAHPPVPFLFCLEGALPDLALVLSLVSSHCLPVSCSVWGPRTGAPCGARGMFRLNESTAATREAWIYCLLATRRARPLPSP